MVFCCSFQWNLSSLISSWHFIWKCWYLARTVGFTVWLNSFRSVQLHLFFDSTVWFFRMFLSMPGGLPALLGFGALVTCVHQQGWAYSNGMEMMKSLPLFLFQRIRSTVDEKEQKQLLMDLDVVMRSSDCPYIVQFYGALFREVGTPNLIHVQQSLGFTLVFFFPLYF